MDSKVNLCVCVALILKPLANSYQLLPPLAIGLLCIPIFEIIPLEVISNPPVLLLFIVNDPVKDSFVILPVGVNFGSSPTAL